MFHITLTLIQDQLLILIQMDIKHISDSKIFLIHFTSNSMLTFSLEANLINIFI